MGVGRVATPSLCTARRDPRWLVRFARRLTSRAASPRPRLGGRGWATPLWLQPRRRLADLGRRFSRASTMATHPSHPPLGTTAPVAATDSTLSTVCDLAGLRVLFVDDEPGVRRLVAVALDRLHATGTVEASPVAALSLVEGEPDRFDVVVTDFRMPEMDGEELFHRIQAVAPSLPVVITSGYADDGRVRDCLAAGASGFLAKPFTIALFAAAVRHGVEGGHG